MRIGVVKQQIQLATNNNQLVLQGTPIYGGQAYRVSNFTPKYRLIESLLSLNLIDPGIFPDDLKNVYDSLKGKDSFELSAQEYNKLNAFFTQINATLPVIQKTVTAFAPDQEEQIINVKLPDGIKKIADLNDYNTRLENVFSKFGITERNGLAFKGFDNGTEWYQILIENVDFFKWVVVAIGIAWSCIKIRKEWLETEIARLTLKSLKKDSKKKDLDKNDDAVKQVLEIKIQEEVNLAFENGLSTFGKGRPEAENQLTNAVGAMIEEIDLGTEFHLSLNPPKNIGEIEENGLTKIDYAQIYEIKPTKKEPVKELSSAANSKDEQEHR